jgi:hypothetical protein
LKQPENLVPIYIYLAVGTAALGVLITWIMLYVTARMGVDIREHMWILAIPPVSAVLINVFLIELYRKYRRR